MELFHSEQRRVFTLSIPLRLITRLRADVGFGRSGGNGLGARVLEPKKRTRTNAANSDGWIVLTRHGPSKKCV